MPPRKRTCQVVELSDSVQGERREGGRWKVEGGGWTVDGGWPRLGDMATAEWR